MKYYPIMINMHDKPAVVIGAGEVALRKVEDLLEGEARVTVIAPQVADALERLAASHPDRLTIHHRPYREGDLVGARLVYSATNDPSVNRRVFNEAEQRGIFVNAVDDPDNCSFIIPSSFRRDDLVVAVSTSGASPSFAARIRRMLENALPQDIGDQLTALREARILLKSHQAHAALSSDERGSLLKMVVNRQELLDALTAAWRNGSLNEFLTSLHGDLPVRQEGN